MGAIPGVIAEVIARVMTDYCPAIQMGHKLVDRACLLVDRSPGLDKVSPAWVNRGCAAQGVDTSRRYDFTTTRETTLEGCTSIMPKRVRFHDLPKDLQTQLHRLEQRTRAIQRHVKQSYLEQQAVFECQMQKRHRDNVELQNLIQDYEGLVKSLLIHYATTDAIDTSPNEFDDLDIHQKE
jgi:hypothetical protein